MMLDQILRAVGIANMPWVARVYLVVLTIFVLLLVFAVQEAEPVVRAGKNLADSDPAMQLLSFCKDAIKLVLGALLGALSAATKTMTPLAKRANSN